MDKNYAYVTLLTTNEFMPGMLALWRSLKETKTKYPLYCVITQEITEENREILAFLGINLIERPEIPLTPTIYKYNVERNFPLTNWYKAFSKFHVFGLEQFDKIVYLDCDLFICKNIDDLFNLPHMSSVVDGEGIREGFTDFLVKGDEYFKYFNSGLMVIEPSMELYNNLIDFINQIVPDRILADQNILSMYYKEWKDNYDLHLPCYYNILIFALANYFEKDWFALDKVKVFHFAGKKPWELGTIAYNAENILSRPSLEYISVINSLIKALNVLGYKSESLKVIL